MKSLSEIQAEAKIWCAYNFGPEIPSWMPLLGIGEELGEIQHSYLKRTQGIRTNEDHNAKIKDGVADLVIFLINFCNQEEINLEKELNETWAKVKTRDWRKNKENGQ